MFTLNFELPGKALVCSAAELVATDCTLNHKPDMPPCNRLLTQEYRDTSES